MIKRNKKHHNSLISGLFEGNAVQVVSHNHKGKNTVEVDVVIKERVCEGAVIGVTTRSGVRKHTLPLNVDVVCCGRCLDKASHVFPLVVVSNDDIKKALFIIGDDKSSRLDGYSSLFFKKSWDFVGEDLCAVVHDFFVFRKLLKHINHSIMALVPKSANVTSANDFKPICYCNVVYKVI